MNFFLGAGLSFFYSILPWFHLLRVFSSILLTTKVQGWNDLLPADSPATMKSLYFGWSNLYAIRNETIISSIDGSKSYYFYPPVVSSLNNLAILSFVYFFLAWYVSLVFHRNQVFYFMFLKEFWGFKRDRIQVQQGDTVAKLQAQSKDEGSVVLYNLSKSYASSTAVKELNLVMQNNQCFCLLGENGSGKSTTINMLTGLFPPTNGHAFIFGFDVHYDVPNIQELIGICPQDDVLWPELSATEHFQLYARSHTSHFIQLLYYICSRSLTHSFTLSLTLACSLIFLSLPLPLLSLLFKFTNIKK